MLKRSLVAFVRNPSLIPQVLSNVVYDYYLLFFPVLLFQFYDDKALVALCYCLIFGSASLLLSSQRSAHWLPLYCLGIAGMCVLGLYRPEWAGYTLAVSCLFALTIRDGQQSTYQTRLSKVSDSARMFSILCVLSLVLLPILSFIANISFSFLTVGEVSSSLVAQMALTALLLVAVMRDRPEVTQVQHQSSLGITKPVALLCWHSTFFNATSFPIRLILVPLTIYGVFETLGYDRYAISLTGSVVGLIAMTGLLVRFLLPYREVDNYGMMKKGYAISVGLITIIALLSLSIHQGFWSPQALPVVVAIVVVCSVGVEVINKFWSIGFIGVLRELSEVGFDGDSQYQRNYLHFLSKKNLGAFLGFAVAALSFAWLGGPDLLVAMGVLAIVYLVFATPRLRQVLAD